jgi:hypothetical protein
MRALLSRIFMFFGGLLFAIAIRVHPKSATGGSIEVDDRSEEFIELQKLHNRLHFTGSCFPVSNYKPHPAANKDYYVVALRNAHEEEKTDVYMFTMKELLKAQDRADKNREDVPEDIGDFDLRIERTED